MSSASRDRCMASVESVKRYSSAKSRSLTASRLFGGSRENPKSLASALRLIGNASAGQRPRSHWATHRHDRLPPRTAPRRAGTPRRAPAASAKVAMAARAACAYSLPSARGYFSRLAPPTRGLARQSAHAHLTAPLLFTCGMRNSVATISLRLRPVCSLAPSGPSFSISAVSVK